jgi:hypothetical protein
MLARMWFVARHVVNALVVEPTLALEVSREHHRSHRHPADQR